MNSMNNNNHHNNTITIINLPIKINNKTVQMIHKIHNLIKYNLLNNKNYNIKFYNKFKISNRQHSIKVKLYEIFRLINY